MNSRKIIKWIVAIILIIVLCYVFCKIYHYYSKVYEEMKIAKHKVMYTAKDDLGEGCSIVYSRYDAYSESYQIGCVSKNGSQAILYIVYPSIDYDDWYIFPAAKHSGGNASELFKTPIINNG